MESGKKTPEELEAIRLKEQQEFIDAAQKAKERGEGEPGQAAHHHDRADEETPSGQDPFQENHGNRKYKSFSNDSVADDIPGTATDTPFNTDRY
ncbi:MAG TPA: hypothetical protein VF581_00355 [Flavobacterium sp.]|jgi:hypothetical protein